MKDSRHRTGRRTIGCVQEELWGRKSRRGGDKGEAKYLECFQQLREPVHQALVDEVGGDGVVDSLWPKGTETLGARGTSHRRLHLCIESGGGSVKHGKEPKVEVAKKGSTGDSCAIVHYIAQLLNLRAPRGAGRDAEVEQPASMEGPATARREEVSPNE